MTMTEEEVVEILSDIRAGYNLFGDEEEVSKYHSLSIAIQAIKAEPVRRGKWKPLFEEYAIDWMQCSECGAGFFGKTNFCPHCGARMETDDD